MCYVTCARAWSIEVEPLATCTLVRPGRIRTVSRNPARRRNALVHVNVARPSVPSGYAICTSHGRVAHCARITTVTEVHTAWAPCSLRTACKGKRTWLIFEACIPPETALKGKSTWLIFKPVFHQKRPGNGKVHG